MKKTVSAKRAYLKWLSARLLQDLPFASDRFRQRMRKRERRYRDARAYGLGSSQRVAVPQAARASSQPCLFLDVTRAASGERIDGLNRTVMQLARALVAAPPRGYAVQPVRYDRIAGVWRETAPPQTGGMAPSPHEAPAAVRKGDLFLALDWHTGLFASGQNLLEPIAEAGARIVSVIYDIIPLKHPEFFPPGLPDNFRTWVHGLAENSDRILCISNAVAGEVKTYLATARPGRPQPEIAAFHLGSDFGPVEQPPVRPPHPAEDAPTVLMVSTVEPRKGYRQAYEAFRILWARGMPVRLTIVGRKGWLVDDLAADLLAHPDPRQLQWLQKTNDAELSALYAQSAVLLAASEAEGFGLPLVEAARHGLPVIARDIPVFREIMGDGAFYFSGLAPADLADAIETWFALREAGRLPPPEPIRVLSWRESAAQLLDRLLEDEPRDGSPFRAREARELSAALS